MQQHRIDNGSPRRRWATRLFAAALLTGSVFTSVGASSTPAAAEGGVADHDWLGIMNAYRAQSGLDPVVANADWSAGAKNHSCWMLLNGIAHDEPAGTPGYTTSGDVAGNSGNVAVTSNPSAPARHHIDLWMSGPFHAIGILRASLHTSGFGLCSSPPNPSTTAWKSGGTLDVVRGNDWGAPKPDTPTVFPGDGATTSLDRFVAESPDPRSFCGWDGQLVGLPLIAMMPNNVSFSTASLTGPNGPVGTCVLNASNTTGTAKAILGGDNAVVIVPNAPLAKGEHTASVFSDGGNVTWTFNVDREAPLSATPPPKPEVELPSTEVIGSSATLDSVSPFRFADSRSGHALTRLKAGKEVRIPVAGKQGLPADVVAISANFTVVGPDDNGFLTAYDCGAGTPDVSTVNYAKYEVVANQALVPLADGDLCLYSHAGTDVLIDVNGFTRSSGSAKFATVDPRRVLDTRSASPLVPGSVMTFDIEGAGSPVPDEATAVAINLTAVDPKSNGWLRVFPCDVAEPDSSSINVMTGDVRANSAVVPTAADGTICLRTTAVTDVLIDVTGWFGPSGAHDFSPLKPIRLADTRSSHSKLNPGAADQRLSGGQELRVQIAGERGIPADATAATLNVVSVDAESNGWLRVVPCGTDGGVSNLNYLAGTAIANGATVKLSADGAVCISVSSSTHVILDITGVWS